MKPFDLDHGADYRSWRDEKLEHYPTTENQLICQVTDPRSLSPAEYRALLQLIGKTGMAIYSSRLGELADKEIVKTLGMQFGLRQLDSNICADEDAISSLETSVDEDRREYIPYTNRPLSWHTDGYYNSAAQQIRAFILHCVRPAREGGVNTLLDHEIAYISLREQNPDYVEALMHPAAMTIPANIVDGQQIRPAVTGPVFSLSADGRLHMRYTHRKRNIRWRDDALTLEAVEFLRKVLETPGPYHFSLTLQPGQGLICNNLLHSRSGFEENSRRLLYRGRYFELIQPPGG